MEKLLFLYEAMELIIIFQLMMPDKKQGLHGHHLKEL